MLGCPVCLNTRGGTWSYLDLIHHALSKLMGGLYLSKQKQRRREEGAEKRWGKGIGGEDGGETVIQVNKLINLIKKITWRQF